MNISYKIVLLVFCIIFPFSVFSRTKRIACVGNSITYGAFIQDRELNSYPAQLQVYLGKDYIVRNFGLSGSTVLKKGNKPYIESKEFEESIDFNPDIVFIKLGTNDSKSFNWKYKDNFKSDYKFLIKAYKELKTKPRIILLTPIRCFYMSDNDINGRIIENEIRKLVEDIAYEEDLEIVNLSNLFGDKWDSSILPDKIHPSSIGAGCIAEKLYKYLNCSRNSSNYVVNRLSEKVKLSEFNFHGYKGFEFYDNGVKCLLVQPRKVLSNHPWVIRARFWNHEPQTDIELLEKGYHITYCDVSNLYGSDKAVERWNRFYDLMIGIGLSKKVVLEGMSRGGLIVYNWAGKNPDKVSCIYADAPVMDIKSWPFKKSDSDTKKLLKAYGFNSEDEIIRWNKNPLDQASVIAEYNIPILHVVGDDDVVVPVKDNTGKFEKLIKEKGGNITIIHKPGVGHHPHSLANPKPIVEFITESGS